MRHLLAAAALWALAVCSAAPAFAQDRVWYTDPVTGQGIAVTPALPLPVVTSATGSATTDRGGTLASGGVAQTAIASNASRKTWCIQNDPAATETLNVRVNGSASATTGVALPAGYQACNPPGVVDTAAVSVYAATTSHRWFGSEGQ